MKISVVAEIEDQANRTALTPAGVADFFQAGHEILVQATAGGGAGFGDDAYDHAGLTDHFCVVLIRAGESHGLCRDQECSPGS